MKKRLFIIATLLTFLLFSCASDDVIDQDNVDTISAPDISNDVDVKSFVDLLPSELLPEPEDFEEPLVRDLDISEIPEEIDSANDILENEIKSVETEIVEPYENLTEKNVEELKNQITELNQRENEKAIETEQKPAAVEITKDTSKTETKKTEVQKIEESKKSDSTNTQKNGNISTINTVIEEEKPVVPLVEKEQKEIIPSRKVTVNTNETLTVTYPGYGWIYLGSESENNNLVSTGRKVENEETIYTLTAKKSGTQLQHFYKVDTITGNFLDDWIEVEVLDNKGSVYTVVKAPEYAEIVPERPEVPAVASSKKTNLTATEILEKEVKPTEKRSFETYVPEQEVVNSTVVEPIIPKPSINDYTENLAADDLLEKAKSLFDAKQFVESQKYVNNFMEIATDKRDEGLYLQGQIFEQDGVTKNIKESINSYTNLVDNYPESDLWDAAKKRIIYLNRFYIQIR